MEFRLLKERYGICELENSLFESRCTEIIDLAIKDFYGFAKTILIRMEDLGKLGMTMKKK